MNVITQIDDEFGQEDDKDGNDGNPMKEDAVNPSNSYGLYIQDQNIENAYTTNEVTVRSYTRRRPKATKKTSNKKIKLKDK